jgi:hypothetical protein
MSNVIDLHDPRVISAATKTLMYEKGLYWSQEPAWREINTHLAKKLGIKPALYGTMATFLSDKEVVVSSGDDEVQFWLEARRTALETDWNDCNDIGT